MSRSAELTETSTYDASPVINVVLNSMDFAHDWHIITLLLVGCFYRGFYQVNQDNKSF